MTTLKKHQTTSTTIPFLHKVLRRIGLSTVLPYKLKSKLILFLAGDHESCQPHLFEVITEFGDRHTGSTDSHIDWHVFFFGAYDPLGVKLMRQLASKIDSAVLLDVGANVGTHTLAIAGFVDSVHSFEPYPKALKRLNKHVQLNDASNVQIHEFGLSTENTSREYYENVKGNFGAGSFECEHGNVSSEPSFKLPLRIGDQFLEEMGLKQVDVIKVDVEGHESLVLGGLQQTLKNCRPAVFFEFGPTTLNHITSQTEFRQMFPDQYQFFQLSYSDWWAHAKPVLTPYRFPHTANVLAIASELSWTVESLVVDQ